MVRTICLVVFLFIGQWGFSQAIQDSALIVLQEKCNICHMKDKPDVVFVKDNMNDFAKKINRQVFIFKLMPKGDEVQLSAEEKKVLKTWIKWAKKQK